MTTKHHKRRCRWAALDQPDEAAAKWAHAKTISVARELSITGETRAEDLNFQYRGKLMYVQALWILRQGVVPNTIELADRIGVSLEFGPAFLAAGRGIEPSEAVTGASGRQSSTECSTTLLSYCQLKQSLPAGP